MEFRELRELNALTVDAAAKLIGVSAKTIYRWENGDVAPHHAFMKILHDKLEQKKRQNGEISADFTFIDLFAGIGGMRRGFESAGGRCIYTSEWDPYAQRTYRANFPDEHEIVGDITKVDIADIPKHDVLLAGFPCQPFSIAGVSKKNALGRAHGFMDKTQGTLFFDVLRILKSHKPAAFLLENVKNLKSHNKGDTFRTIIGALENELGYNISYTIIDGKGYTPQHRERIYIAGFRNDVRFRFENFKFNDPLCGPKLDSILHSPDEEIETPYTVRPAQNIGNKNSEVNEKYTLTNKLWEYLQNYAQKHKAKGNGFGFGLVTKEDTARTLSARYYKDGSEILVHQEGKNPRRLTPRECARLMGFDSDKNNKMIIPVSDTRAYQQFGNSVVVPVIEAIADKMKPYVMEVLNSSCVRESEAAD